MRKHYIGDRARESPARAVPARTNRRARIKRQGDDNAGFSLGSAAPGLVLGTAAAMVTANPLVGIGVGMLGPSYIQNWGDVYGSSKEDKGIRARLENGELSQKDLAKWTAIAAVPMAALDIAGIETVLGATVFREAKQALGKAIIKGVITGGIAEGSTEGLQEVISQWAQHYLGSNTTFKEKAIAVIDNALQGMFGGAVMGAGGATVRQLRPGAEERSTEEEIDPFMASARGRQTREEIDEFLRQREAKAAQSAQPAPLALPAGNALPICKV